MKQSIRLILAGALVFAGAACTKVKSAKPQKISSSKYVANEFIFSGNQETVAKYLTDQGLQAKFELLDAEDGFYHVKVEGDADVEQILSDLKGITRSVEPNWYVHPIASIRKAEWPTDKLFFKQWALNNIGQSAPYGLPGVRGADMDVIRVWNNVTKGSDEIVVAVIDTGCDVTHPDLKDNIWVNTKESPAHGGIPGKDDDGNGYIDDVYGYDFVSSGRTSFKGFPGDSEAFDDSGHGTHCAGSIGAQPNNAIGIAGLNWKVKIMCVRFLSDMGGTSVDAFRAVRYARENGAHIMSNSWGGTSDESELFKSELRKAERQGILFVAAAGNNGTNNDIQPHYPSNLSNAEYRGQKFTNVISVAASDNMDAPADFTNYGHETVDIFAPGVAIVSTYPQNLTPEGRPPYAIMSGTSMAAPYVAGVAALMMAANPALKGKPAEVIRLINETADVKDTMIGKVRSNGRINAYKAVTAQLDGPKPPEVWRTKQHVIDQRGFQTELVDIRHEIKVEGAKSIKVHFDFLQIDEPYDSVYLYDKNLRLVARIEQNLVDDFWSPAIPGDTVYVRFVNSWLQQVTRNPFQARSEADCVSRGAVRIEKIGETYNCEVDSENSSSNGGSKKYYSFNSEGFRIDQVAYLEGKED